MISRNNDSNAKRSRLTFNVPIPEISKVKGTLLVCGMGETGQLGLGEDEMEKKRFTVVPTLENFNIVEVSAGGMHSVCLTSTGEVYTFGCNDEGALGRDTSIDGSEFTPSSVDLPGKVVKITAGDSHSSCLLANGTVYAWGSFRDSHGNMGLTIEGNKRLPVAILPELKFCNIESGADHLVLLTVNGKLYTFGCAEQGQLGRISLRSASGDSRRGKTTLLSPEMVFSRKLAHCDAIWATTYCTYAKPFDKQNIYAFGLNNYSQLGLKKKSTTQLCINAMETNFENVKKIVGGQHHTMVLTEDNKCYAIGRSEYGRLGLGKKIENDVINLQEIPLLKDKNIIDIGCGDAQSFAITDLGDLYSWGMGSNLQLGTGSEDDAEEPVLIVSKQVQNKKIFKVSSGGHHTMVLIKKDSDDNIKEIKKDVKTNKADVEIKDLNGGPNATTTKIESNGNVESNGDVIMDSNSTEAAKRNRKRRKN